MRIKRAEVIDSRILDLINVPKIKKVNTALIKRPSAIRADNRSKQIKTKNEELARNGRGRNINDEV